MGLIIHDAIIVTTWSRESALEARMKADELGLPTSDLCVSPINSYSTFLICPDGSKEGWRDSTDAEIARAAWCRWAREDSTSLQWVHVRYGHEFERPPLIAGSSFSEES